MPWHAAAWPVVGPAQSLRNGTLRGAPLTATHLPFWPVSPQASHWLLQALSQQTLSTQLPESH